MLLKFETNNYKGDNMEYTSYSKVSLQMKDTMTMKSHKFEGLHPYKEAQLNTIPTNLEFTLSQLMLTSSI